jgi:hypothetical protein
LNDRISLNIKEVLSFSSSKTAEENHPMDEGETTKYVL